MRARRTVKERDIVKILVFGYDRTLIKYQKEEEEVCQNTIETL